MNDLDSREITTLCLCAFRYAMDRNTGISYEISNIIMRHADNIYPWAKEQMKRDIERKIVVDGFKYPCDLENWVEMMERI